MPTWLRSRLLLDGVILTLLLLLLCVADALCYRVALPVEIDQLGDSTTLHVGSQTLSLGEVGTLTAMQFASHDELIHEYQIDGTDSTNNFTLDTNYLSSIEPSPYYRFQSWMRNLDGTSHWRNLHVLANGHTQVQNDWPAYGSHFSLSSATSLQIQVQLQRPETPVRLDLFTQNGTTLHILFDRNNRRLDVTQDTPLVHNGPVASTFFPVDPLPFAAMVIDTLLRTSIWAILVLLVVCIGETIIATWKAAWYSVWTVHAGNDEASLVETQEIRRRFPRLIATSLGKHGSITLPTKHLQGMPLHPLAFVALLVSFCFVAWIAAVQYHAEPHIFDASAYLFAAKMYASGQLSVPVPDVVDRFPGPFMVQFAGRWFAQYAPGTGLTLAPGIWLGVPWLIEPLLGTFALLGIGLIATRLYHRHVGTLAVVLGVLSPFYSYLAASYLSHTIALFYLVWGLWALLRFTQGEAWWNMPLSAALFGMALLTRDLVAILFVAIVVPCILLLSWRRVYKEWRRWLAASAPFLLVGLLFVALSLEYNMLLSGSPWIAPRSLFFAGDHWGFGENVGFYGRHTVAAGFVNLDELLTILAIDLFGWPFYLSFVFLIMPFLVRYIHTNDTHSVFATDCFLLFSAFILTFAYIGYFYHGIYLGPRYLFETLPFLLILTARGILTLGALGTSISQRLYEGFKNQPIATSLSTSPTQSKTDIATRYPSLSMVTIILVALLISCNLLYFLPRQIDLHNEYTGLPAGYKLDLTTIYQPHLHNAIIVTNDFLLYQFVLFPLNDPQLHNDVLYAMASNTQEYEELHKAFPDKTLYHLEVHADGSTQYTLISPISP